VDLGEEAEYPSVECRRRGLNHPSMYRKIAERASARVGHDRRWISSLFSDA
jgi:hypothetical protein